MELISNLAWLAVAITLWGLWLAHRRSPRNGSLLPAISLQIVALAAVTAILLPPISITDDLHCCQLPAEVKRNVAQADRQVAPLTPAGVLPFTLAMLALCLDSLRPRSINFLPIEQPAFRQLRGYLHFLWCRPPPAAIA